MAESGQARILRVEPDAEVFTYLNRKLTNISSIAIFGLLKV